MFGTHLKHNLNTYFYCSFSFNKVLDIIKCQNATVLFQLTFVCGFTTKGTGFRLLFKVSNRILSIHIFCSCLFFVNLNMETPIVLECEAQVGTQQ
jgi:hypothetical protein